MNSTIGEMPAVSLLDNLLNKYHIWIISNTTNAHIRSLQKNFSFLLNVNGIITSESAGFHKPNPAIFEFALKKAEVNTSSAIFIDDSMANTKSAKNVGITAHHYNEFDSLLAFLS